MTVAKKVIFPAGASCGSGYHLSVGHNSDVYMFFEIDSSKMKTEFAPLPPTSEILSIS